jgi:(E)-4-hydroxy-3-methyl-but-2-enyl pyrophosphate reductase
MQYMLAKTAGFCWGVERAINGVAGKRKKFGEPLQVLGQLVHNRDAVRSLEEQGITVIETIEEAQGVNITITAHGRDPKDIARARSISSDVLDMTCPIVKDQHLAALRLKAEGRKMILVGMRSRPHAEVAGTVGVLENEVYLIESVEQIDGIPYDSDCMIGVIAQTTFDEAKVLRIVEAIRLQFPDTMFISTLCDDITAKQEELRRSGPAFDTVIVVGDSKSANTIHLVEIARDDLHLHTIFVLNESELTSEALHKAQRIFITAGASTPAVSITGIIKKLQAFGAIESMP